MVSSGRPLLHNLCFMFAGLILGYFSLPSVAHAQESSFDRGVAKERRGDYEGAIAEFTEILALNSDFAEAYYWRGRAKGDSGDCQGAVQDFTRTLLLTAALDPRSQQLGEQLNHQKSNLVFSWQQEAPHSRSIYNVVVRSHPVDRVSRQRISQRLPISPAPEPIQPLLPRLRLCRRRDHIQQRPQS